MKKKMNKFAVAGLLVGCLTVGTMGSVALAGGNAYEDYKAAVLQTATAQNMTVKADVTVKEDGVAVLTGETFVQTDLKDSYAGSTVQANGNTLDMETARSGNETLIRHGDTYTALISPEYSEGKGGTHELSANGVKLMNMVTDLLVGDVKSHFAKNGDTITVDLDGAQIPELLNVAVSTAAEQAGAKADSPEFKHDKVLDNDNLFGDALWNLIITENVQIKSIHLDGTVQNGYLTNNNLTVVLTGNDSAGVFHEVELFLNAQVSDIGSTSVGTIDTEGKEITVIEQTRNSRH